MSGNLLKLIAAVCMFLDHLGYEVYPDIEILRILGRLSFPVFSYFIYEGCRYTRHRWKYLLRILSLGILCLMVYYLFCGEWYGNILLTLSCSICNVYALKAWKNSLLRKQPFKQIGITVVFIALMAATYLLCLVFPLDYGFYGVMLPVFAELFHVEQVLPENKLLHHEKLPLLGFAIGLLLLCLDVRGNHQPFCFFTLPMLALYNGKRGKWKMKYFFYLYYPLQFLLVELVAILVKG